MPRIFRKGQRQAILTANIYLLLVVQDAIGAPPDIAVAEKDGHKVAIKLFMDYQKLNKGAIFTSQPGRLAF